MAVEPLLSLWTHATVLQDQHVERQWVVLVVDIHMADFVIARYFRLVLITILHVQTDHLSFVSDKGIPKSNTTIQRRERVLRTCPLALENMALVAEFEVSVPDFRLFFKALQSSRAVRTQVLCPKHHGRHT
jgi:hypothetical protein